MIEREGGFHVSSRCQDGGCVGVRVGADAVTIRNERNPAGGSIEVPPTAWSRFTATLRRGRLELPS